MLLALVFLLALLPWPAPGRTSRERRGYMMSAALDDVDGPFLIQQFSTSAYYWMCRHPDFIQQDLSAAKLLKEGAKGLSPHSELLKILR